MRENLSFLRDFALAIAADNDPRGLKIGDSAQTIGGRIELCFENDLTSHEAYYFDLMEERGLVRFLDNRTRVHLTADGQDFVHAVADDKIWDHIKEWVLETPFNLNEIKKSARHARIIVSAASVEPWK